MSATLTLSSRILKALYSDGLSDRGAGEECAFQVATLKLTFCPRFKALTYERQSTLFGRLLAARKLARHRRRPFDALEWLEANRP